MENFKGIKNQVIKFDAKDTSIYGNNATYKTTTMDGFLWLLFNKDSEDKEDTNFTIKPQDKDGKDIMGTESLVEAELSIDGKPLKLKKVRHEKWTKRQGTGETVFDGHQRKYWFDEEPVNATKYKEKINELLTEDIFKMITNPLYFNTQVDWRKRLEMLFEIYIKETDLEIISSNSRISKLAEILDGKEIESYENILKDKIKNLKKESKDLPPRIDELILSIPQEEPDYAAIETELEKNKQKLSGIEFLLTNATNKANKITEKYQELNRLHRQLEEIKIDVKAKEGTGRQESLTKQQELNQGQFVLAGNIQALESQIEGYSRDIEHGEKELTRFRAEWTELTKKKQEILAQTHNPLEIETHCPTCEQELPEEMIENKLADLKINFDKAIEVQLKRVNSDLGQNQIQGKSTKEKVDQAIKGKEVAEKELSEKKTALAKLQEELEGISKELNEPQPEPDYTKYPEIADLSKKIDGLAYELDQPVEDKSAELLGQKVEVQNKINELNKILNSKEEVTKKKERIEFLKNEEKRIANLIAELEGHNFLIDEFYMVKTEMVNKHFEHVRFRFFEDNDTNDGRQKMCVAEVNTNGSYVKFDDANTAGQVNAGLDIINILCDFYEVRAPIFIDNAERITDLIETDSQVIRLVKPEIRNEEDREKYSQLVVEVQE